MKLANKRGERVTNRKRVLFTEIQPSLSYTTNSNLERVANEKLVLFTGIQTPRAPMILTTTYCYLLDAVPLRRTVANHGVLPSTIPRSL